MLDKKKGDLALLDLDSLILSKLQANNIFTIEELNLLGEKELKKLKRIGKGAISHIKDALSDYNNFASNPLVQLDLPVVSTMKGTKLINVENLFTKEDLEFALNNIQQQNNMEYFNSINEIRTVILEQARILESIRFLSQPDSVINKISEKVPGFNKMVYDLYKKLFNEKD